MEFTRICAQQTRTEDGETLLLDYDLVHTPGQPPHWGVRIRMQLRGRCESATFRYITTSRQQALILIRRLAEGLVTPTCLDEVLEELFARQELN